LFKITLKQLEYFAKAAETGSLADAARELYISQPTISNAITKLEDSLDVDLFIRHHAHGVSLTSTGGRLLPEVRSLLSQTGELVRSAQGLRQEVQGRLHLGCFNPLSSVHIPKLVTEFRKQHPDAEIRLYEDNTEKLISGLENNDFDMIITYQLYGQQTFTQEVLASLKPYEGVENTLLHCLKRKGYVPILRFNLLHLKQFGHLLQTGLDFQSWSHGLIISTLMMVKKWLRRKLQETFH